MGKAKPVIRNISDTAFWIAAYRAQESARPDAHFIDEYAEKLAGERGREIITSDKYLSTISWPFIARTFLLDKIVDQHIKEGGDVVINLAAGLDTRPYRMSLPSSLQWVEVDLPDLFDYKEMILADAKPQCRLERIRLDLSQREARKMLFENLGQRGKNILVITEGLLLYLLPNDVTALAQDLHEVINIRKWAMDLVSKKIVAMINSKMKINLTEAGAPFQFYPDTGVYFFETLGWKAVEIHSQIKTAAKLNRLPFMLKLMSMLPTPKPPFGNKPWSCICLFERNDGV